MSKLSSRSSTDQPKKETQQPKLGRLSIPLLLVVLVVGYSVNSYAPKSWQSLNPIPELHRLSFDSLRTLLNPVKPLDAWIEQEKAIAWNQLLANIHPQGTLPGTLVASPSTDSPNYWYQWTRDSALVMRPLVHSFISEPYSPTAPLHKRLILEYINATIEMQHKSTLIGDFSSGGLGEVKYHVDYEPFRGTWGRPQNDGPASRIITLVKFARFLWEHGAPEEREFVKTVLYDGALPTRSVIKGDLEHLAKRWRDPSFDLWEEVSGTHYYTLLSIRTALLSGSSLALDLSDAGAAAYYLSQAEQINAILPQFWSSERSIIQVTVNHTGSIHGKKSGLDAAVVLASLHSGLRGEWEDNEWTLATVDKFIESMRLTYPLNKNREIPALGRYPEDIYDGVSTSLAHPWYLITLAFSEYLYLLSSHLSVSHEPLIISHVSRSFYNRFLPVEIEDGKVIEPFSKERRIITEAQREMADGFMLVVKEFAARNGSMSEQFDRISGEGRGARDLSWSYAAFITASEARSRG